MKHLGLVCWLICALAAPVDADGVADEADLQFTVGAEAYGKGEFTAALEHFLASNRLVSNRNVMFNIARAYEQLGRFPDAYRYYIDASRGEASDGKLQRDVTAALARIGPRVAVLSVETTPPGATVFLDRRDLGSVGSSPAQLGLKAGTYTVLAELPGFERAMLSGVVIATGENRPVKLELVRILGKVELAGEPGTRVRIDDERGAVACTLPCALDLPPGQHLAYFERSGFTVTPQTFTIVEKQTVRSSASAVAVVGSLLVAADEPNALIEVDGRALGFTPAVISNIPIGHRRVRVSLRGYKAVEREVEVRINAQTDLRDLVLSPERSVSAASRESEAIEDAPASVTVISAQELEAFAYPTILESLRGVRGFAINFDSIYGNAAVRGLGQANDFSNRLLVLSDGAVLNENILYQPFIHYDGRTDLGDVQRIEIVRGPSSVLYGTGAVSGVVNLVLKDRDEPEGVHAQISSYDNSTARVRVGFVQRFGHDAGMWASVSGASSQGREVSLPVESGTVGVTPPTTQGFDKFHSYTMSGKIWFKDLTLQSFWTAREDTIPTGNYGSRFGDTRSFGDDQRFLTEVKLDHKFTPAASLMVRAHLNYAYYHSDYWYDADPEMPQSGTADTYNYFETYKSWWGGGEARATLDLGGHVRLTLGGEAVVHERANMEGGQYDVGHTTLTRGLHVDAPYQVIAGSALMDWRPVRQLRVQAGLRFDYWNLMGNQFVDSADRGATSLSAASPRLAIITKPTDDDIVKLMIGSAFRAPSAYERYYSDGGSTQVPSNTCGDKLKPETIYSAELEGTHKFDVDWAGIVSVYGTVARDVVESVPLGDACGARTNLDPNLLFYRNSNVDQQVLGTDVELRRELRAGVMASVQYGYNHGRYASAPTSDPTLPQSTRLPNAPTQYAGFKVIFPIVTSAVTGALRAALEDRRRIDTTTTAESERAVVVDAVVSGAVARHGLRYAVGVYNLLNWQYALPAVPYATNLMPQNGRSFIFSLTLTR